MKKRLIVLVVALGLLMGCAGFNVTIATNIATDIAFVAVLENNPSMKPFVVETLQRVKVFVDGSVTYDDLLLEISKQFPGKYAYVGIILSGYIETDKPVFETYLPMFDAYKADIVKKIDRLILLARI